MNGLAKINNQQDDNPHSKLLLIIIDSEFLRKDLFHKKVPSLGLKAYHLKMGAFFAVLQYDDFGILLSQHPLLFIEFFAKSTSKPNHECYLFDEWFLQLKVLKYCTSMLGNIWAWEEGEIRLLGDILSASII